jgi:predicted HTH domain antitoxin
MVEIMVHLPEDVAGRFGNTPETAARQLLESAAVEGYRSQRLSRGQVREMLGLSWQETEDFLGEHGCVRHYTLSDLDEDRQTLADLPIR